MTHLALDVECFGTIYGNSVQSYMSEYFHTHTHSHVVPIDDLASVSLENSDVILLRICSVSFGFLRFVEQIDAYTPSTSILKYHTRCVVLAVVIVLCSWRTLVYSGHVTDATSCTCHQVTNWLIT